MGCVLTLNAVPNIGDLFGSSGSDALLRQINNEMQGSNFFGGTTDYLAKARSMFVENIIQPIRDIGNTLRNIINITEYDDRVIAITEEEMLKCIPTSMHMPILTYAPMKKLFDEGRIFGFGYEYVPEEDVYGRLISNGTVEHVLDNISDEGEIIFNYEFRGDDPELSFDELQSIRETREFIDWILENTDYDPTDYDNRRG